MDMAAIGIREANSNDGQEQGTLACLGGIRALNAAWEAPVQHFMETSLLFHFHFQAGGQHSNSN